MDFVINLFLEPCQQSLLSLLIKSSCIDLTQFRANLCMTQTQTRESEIPLIYESDTESRMFSHFLKCHLSAQFFVRKLSAVLLSVVKNVEL